MSLKIVYGRAGSGKTWYCLNKIKEEMNKVDSFPLVLIVPEQFSLQAEKNLAREAGSNGIYRAEVLSFRRLAYRVFSEVGGISRHHLDTAGKSMLLFRILNNLGSSLKIYSKAALRKGFTGTLSEMITEFKRYDITPDQLKEASTALKEGLPLRDKLHDLSLIYEEFERLLHKKYLDADDDLTELYKKLDESTQLDGAEIWIDEFSGFTPQEYKVIGKLLQKARRVTVSLCTDCLSSEPGDGSPMVFAPVRKTAAKLIRLAKEAGVEVEKPVALDRLCFDGHEISNEGYGKNTGQREDAGEGNKNGVNSKCMPVSVRFLASGELGHLERNFYKYPYSKYTKSSGDVIISSSANIYSEVEDAARDIIRLCRDHGYRYRDIAVTMRNPDSYDSIIKNVFTRYGIPYFLDGKRDIDGHPLITFILSALSIFNENWSYNAVFRYAKTGLTGVAREDIDLLENYVLANGIKGNLWTTHNDWDYPVEPARSGDKPSKEEKDCLDRINASRWKLVKPLLTFREKTKGGVQASVFCTALYELLCDTGADRRIEELTEELTAKGLLDKAGEYRQVWNIAMNVFSQIVEVLGEEKLGTERFSEILAAGFDGYKIGLIPPAIDQVLAGSIERARSHDIKALYILGVNEGVIPGTKGDDALLSDRERDSLAEIGLELAGNTAARCMEERFMVYMALSTPSRYLYLSYPAADADGRALRPSRLISEVRRILPNVVVRSTVAKTEDEEQPLPCAPVPAFDELAVQLRHKFDGNKIDDRWRYIYRWFAEHEDWKDKCGIIIKGLGHSNQGRKLTADKTARLYGKPFFTSISRMEAYSSCPFAFFVKYGLRAKERRMYRFDPIDAGTFMHSIIDEFSRMLVKKGISWRGLDREWCAEQVSALVDMELGSKKGNVLGSSKRYLYLSKKLKRTVTKAIILISRHIEAGSFEPAGYEVEFSDTGRYPPITIELPSGECIKMTGRIDRIDTMTDESGTYLRIIDYKSGNKALKLQDVYYGLQLQLVTYMDAVLGMEGTNDDLSAGQVKAQGTAVSGERNSEVENPVNLNEEKPDTEKSGVIIPAGILYFRLDDPLIRCDRNSTSEEIEKAILKELRMKGLVLADVRLVKEMDKNMEGDSLIIPARINKDGTLGRSSAATREQFEVLRKYIRKILASIGNEILDGNVIIRPYKKKSITACTYCSFSPVCQFDTSMKDNRYRIIQDYNDEEFWRLIREAGDTGNERPQAEAGNPAEIM